MTLRLTTVAATLAVLLAQPVQADVLLLDAIQNEPVNSAEGLPRPTRGMTMDQVLKRFGQPAIEHPRVGQPPITRWDYQDYSVFFEHQYVLDAVVHR